jgi:hypothetical protein
MLGVTGTAREWRSRDGWTLEELDLPVLRQRVWSGDSAWEEDDGFVTELPARRVADKRRLNAIEFGDALLGGMGASVALLPDEEMDGRSWSVLRVSFGDPDAFDLFLDRATGALHAYRATRDRSVRTTRLSDWRMVGGVRFPFLRRGAGADGNQASALRVRRITLDEPVDVARTVRPEGRRRAAFVQSAVSTGALPFSFRNGNRIYIPARINGRPVEVLLDSAADVTAIDRAFAEEIGLVTAGSGVVVGSGGSAASSWARNVMVEIGNLRLDHSRVTVLDLSDVSRRLGIPLPVILGRPAFDELVVDIDFTASTIGFHAPAAFAPPPGARAVPLTRYGGNRTVPVSIEGGPPVEVEFDLGSAAYMDVYPSYWQPRRLLEGRRQSRSLSGAIGGAAEHVVATLRSLDFAGERFTGVPASFTTPGSTLDSDRSAGLLGLSILSRFRLMIDYGRDRLFAAPLGDAHSRPFPKDRSGLGFDPGLAGLAVAHVAPGSPAAEAGWKAGEVIARIDGVPVGTGGDPAARPRLDLLPAGRTIRFDMADGSARTLVLADYF